MISDPLYVFLTVCMLGFSLVMTLVSGLSYLRVGNRKLLMVGGAFLVMAVKGITLGLGILGIVDFTESTPLLILDMGVLAFLYLAAASR